MAAALYPTGMPPKQGLYDPANEHDACGIGFIAHAKGKKSHDIVRKGLDLLENLTHRGAAGCDPCSGDGAGILMQIPHGFFSRVCAEAGISLPGEGEYAAGMFFLPLDAADAERCMEVVERVIAEEGLALLGWREVPADASVVGPEARKTLPAIRQCFIAREGVEEDAFERKLFRTRKRIEKAIGASEITFSTTATHASRSLSSSGRKNIPAAYSPSPGSWIPISPHTRERKACGTCIRIPAPSPLHGSHPAAPRCVRFSRSSSPFSTMSCDFRPLACAMKPMPHASCSFAGSYRPCFGGIPVG